MKRSREVANGMSKGIDFLMKKNKVSVITGTASFLDAQTLVVAQSDGSTKHVTATNIIIATGHKPRTFPHLPVDGKRVVNYRHLLGATQQPKSLLCIGAGAIGMEFGYFFNAMGSAVTVVEVMEQVLPVEDVEVAKVVERAFTKAGVAIKTSTKVTKLDVQADGVTVHLEKGGQAEVVKVDTVLVAVGFRRVHRRPQPRPRRREARRARLHPGR